MDIIYTDKDINDLFQDLWIGMRNQNRIPDGLSVDDFMMLYTASEQREIVSALVKEFTDFENTNKILDKVIYIARGRKAGDTSPKTSYFNKWADIIYRQVWDDMAESNELPGKLSVEDMMTLFDGFQREGYAIALHDDTGATERMIIRIAMHRKKRAKTEALAFYSNIRKMVSKEGTKIKRGIHSPLYFEYPLKKRKKG